MPLPIDGRRAVARIEGSALETLRAWLAFLRQKIGAKPVEERAKRRLTATRVEIEPTRPTCPSRPSRPRHLQNVRGKHRKLRMSNRPGRQKPVHASTDIAEDPPKALRRASADGRRRQITRSDCEVAAEQIGGDEPALEQRRKPDAQTSFGQLREDQPDVVIGSGETSTNPQRSIERFFDQPRNRRVVGQLEAWIDVRFQRELAQERQTKGVDRRDCDVAEAAAQVPPFRGVELQGTAGFPQPVYDPLAHFGGGLAREGHREDVVGIHSGAQQVDIPLHEDASLAGSG